MVSTGAAGSPPPQYSTQANRQPQKLELPAASPGPASTAEVYGPPEPAAPQPQDRFQSEIFRLDGEQFQEPPLQERVIEFIDDLGGEEKALLGGAYVAGGLATGKAKVSFPVGDGVEIGAEIRTRPNRAAREIQEDLGRIMLPHAKPPENPGVKISLRAPF